MIERTLICYGTRYETTTSIVEEMVRAIEELGKTVDVVNLKRSKPSAQPEEYDLVIIGSGIQAGQWTKEPLKFIENNIEQLAKTKTAIFVVCGYAASEEKCGEAQTDFLDAIVEKYPGFSPTSTGLFPGMFDFKKYNFAMRALVKRIVKGQLPPGEKVPEKVDYRDWELVRNWVTELVQ